MRRKDITTKKKKKKHLHLCGSFFFFHHTFVSVVLFSLMKMMKLLQVVDIPTEKSSTRVPLHTRASTYRRLVTCLQQTAATTTSSRLRAKKRWSPLLFGICKQLASFFGVSACVYVCVCITRLANC